MNKQLSNSVLQRPLPGAFLDLPDYVWKTLRDAGVPFGLRGHSYLGHCIWLCLRDPAWLYHICDLYAACGKAFDTTGSRVERAIRHAVEQSFLNITCDKWSELYGAAVNPDKAKLTNSACIHALTLYARKLRGQEVPS